MEATKTYEFIIVLGAMDGASLEASNEAASCCLLP
jgi:hypothetical protein